MIFLSQTVGQVCTLVPYCNTTLRDLSKALRTSHFRPDQLIEVSGFRNIRSMVDMIFMGAPSSGKYSSKTCHYTWLSWTLYQGVWHGEPGGAVRPWEDWLATEAVTARRYVNYYYFLQRLSIWEICSLQRCQAEQCSRVHCVRDPLLSAAAPFWPLGGCWWLLNTGLFRTKTRLRKVNVRELLFVDYAHYSFAQRSRPATTILKWLCADNTDNKHREDGRDAPERAGRQCPFRVLKKRRLHWPGHLRCTEPTLD